MTLRRSCKDVTHLVLEGQDRPLRLAERLSLRLHWLACANCSRFRQQAATMQKAVKLWRNYRDE